MRENGKRKWLDEIERKRKWRGRRRRDGGEEGEGLEGEKEKGWRSLHLSSTEEEKKMEDWTDGG